MAGVRACVSVRVCVPVRVCARMCVGGVAVSACVRAHERAFMYAD